MPLAHELVTPDMWEREANTARRTWPTWWIFGDTVETDMLLSDAQQDVLSRFMREFVVVLTPSLRFMALLGMMRSDQTALSCCQCRTTRYVTTANYTYTLFTGRCPACPSLTNS